MNNDYAKLVSAQQDVRPSVYRARMRRLLDRTAPENAEPAVRRSRLRLGLRTKIILWAFVPTAIILLLVALVTFAAYQKVTELLVLERDKELTRLRAGQIGTTLQEYGAQLAVETRQKNLISPDGAVRQSALSRARSRQFVFDGGLLLINAQGEVVNATAENSSMVGQNWSQEPIFQDVLATGPPINMRPVVSERIVEIYGSGGSTGGTIAVAAPISVYSDNEELWGVLIGLFELGETSISTFYGDIVRLRIAPRGNAYLVDGSGHVIYHSNSSQIGADYSDREVVQQVVGEPVVDYSAYDGLASRLPEPRGDAIRTTDRTGDQIVAGFAPIPGTSWGLVTETRWWLLLSASQEFQPFLLALLLLGILAPAVFVSVGVRRITEPINRLIGATQNVAKGNFAPLLETNSGDEIDTLSTHFNQMSIQLESSYTQLEKRVSERTRELVILNELAEAVNSSLDLDNILQQALEKMTQALETDGGGIYLFDDEHHQLKLAAHIGLPASMVDDVTHLALGEGFNGFVAESGQPMTVDDICADGRLTRTGVLDVGLKSLACVPLTHKDDIIGTLYAVSFESQLFVPRDLTMLASIGHHAAIAIANARLYQQGQRLAAMEERSRLARELHDSVTQSLYSLTLLAEGWRRIAQDGKLGDVTEPLTELGDLGKQALREMRLLVYELRPPDLEKEGLLGAIHKRLSAVEKRAGVDARLIADQVVNLPKQQEEHLYWIAQEALSNSLKHSGADRVRIRLSTSHKNQFEEAAQRIPALAYLGTLSAEKGKSTDSSINSSGIDNELQAKSSLILEIEDNGCGFDVDSLNQPDSPDGGMGLMTMRERAARVGGELEIESALGKGTCVRVRILEQINDC